MFAGSSLYKPSMLFLSYDVVVWFTKQTLESSYCWPLINITIIVLKKNVKFPQDKTKKDRQEIFSKWFPQDNTEQCYSYMPFIYLLRGWGRVWTLIRPILVLGALKLHFEALHPDLEPIHGLDGRLSARWVVEAHKSCNSNSTICEIFQNNIHNQGLIEIFSPFLFISPRIYKVLFV